MHTFIIKLQNSVPQKHGLYAHAVTANHADCKRSHAAIEVVISLFSWVVALDE
jgi:hypothetical protein